METPPRPIHNSPDDQESDPELREHVEQAVRDNAAVADADGYDEMTVDELRRLASARQMTDRTTARSKGALVAGLRNLDALEREADDQADPGEPSDDVDPDDPYADLDPALASALRNADEMSEAHSGDHAELLEQAQTMSAMELRVVLTDRPKLPKSVREQLEALIREQERAPIRAPEDGMYRVTADSQWSRRGHIFQLAAGSVVRRKTHDLDELRRQGVPLEPIREMETQHDRLGRPVSVTRK